MNRHTEPQVSISLLWLNIVLSIAALGCALPQAQPQPAHQPQTQPQARSQQAQTIQGRVVAIADGDTLTVLDATNTQRRIRLQGIDAPERHQDFGTRAQQHLSALAFNKEVTVEYNSSDRYGRILGKVLVGGQDINLVMVRDGLAWFYRQYQNDLALADRQSYELAEQSARSARRGLWADANPTPPWDFRRSNRDSGAGNNNTRPAERPAPAATNSNTATPHESAAGPIIGNRRSRIYHWPGCPNYNDVSPQNRVSFSSREEAERAGYRAARNCP